MFSVHWFPRSRKQEFLSKHLTIEETEAQGSLTCPQYLGIEIQATWTHIPALMLLLQWGYGPHPLKDDGAVVGKVYPEAGEMAQSKVLATQA